MTILAFEKNGFFKSLSLLAKGLFDSTYLSMEIKSSKEY